MATIDELRALAREIREERQIGGNTGARVGNTFDKVADLLESTGGDISDIREAVEQLLQDVGFIPRDISRTATDAVFTNSEGELLFWLRAATDTLAGLITAANNNKLIALPTAEELAQALAAKQNRLTFDPRPIEGSTNPVTSDGINTAIANFVTRSVSDLIYYYTKSETYTKEEVNALVAAIKQFVPVVAQTLPTPSADTMYKLYLIPSEDPQESNIKDEYITIDNGVSANPRYTWEKIGSVDIDISGKADIGTVPAGVTRTASDATFVNNNHVPLFYLRQATSSLAGLMTAAEHNKLDSLPTAQDLNTSLDSIIYDVSAKNPTAGPNNDGKFTLAYILNPNNVNTLIPTDVRKGGMTIKFVQTSDNKYVKFRYMSSSTDVADFTNVANWQGVDDEPTAGSKNLVESGGVADSITKVKMFFDESDLNNISSTGKSIVSSNNWTSSGNSIFIPIKENIKNIKITSKEKGTVICFLKSDSTNIVDFCDNTVRTSINPNSEYSFNKPEDCKFLYVLKTTTGGSYLFDSITIELYNELKSAVDDLNGEIENINSNLDDINEELIDVEDTIYDNIETPVDFKQRAYINAETGELVSAGNFRATDLIPINPGDQIQYYCYQDANNYVCAYYNSNQEFLSNLSIVGTGSPSEHTVRVPEGVAYFRLASYIKNAPTPFGNTIIKKGIDERVATIEQKIESPFKNKTVLFIGDSITDQGYYINHFVSLTGCIPINRGVSGTTIAKNNYVADSMVERLDKEASESSTKNAGFPSNPDVIFFLGGVNDWGRQGNTQTPFGSLDSDIDNETFCGAVRYMFKGLIEKYPQKPIIILLPLHVFGFNAENFNWSEIIYSNGESSSYVVNTNGTGKTFYDYRNVIEECARLYGLPTIDLFNVFSPITSVIKSLYTNDGLHPNNLGGKKMAKYIVLKANTLIM